MKLNQAFLLALTAVQFAYAIPQRGGRGNNNNQQDQNNQNQNQDQNQNGQNATQVTGQNGNDQTGTGPNGGGNNGGGNNAGGNTCLDQANIQANSDSTGQANAAKGQSDSLTDAANFINFCSGKQITNGLQVKGGSCNGIVMGDMPSSDNMISAMFVSPGPGEDIAANQDFTISVQIQGLVAGTFTNPDLTYYAAPQQLQGGQVVGHTHVTVQDIGQIDSTTPPNPADFVFFKGINDAGNGAGLLSAQVAGGLAAGTYRVCSMTSSSNHQPVLMPVAQRGAQDDCQKFTVGQGNGNNNAGGGAGGNGNNAGGNGNNAGGNNQNAGGNTQNNAGGNAQNSTTGGQDTTGQGGQGGANGGQGGQAGGNSTQGGQGGATDNQGSATGGQGDSSGSQGGATGGQDTGTGSSSTGGVSQNNGQTGSQTGASGTGADGNTGASAASSASTGVDATAAATATAAGSTSTQAGSGGGRGRNGGGGRNRWRW